MMGLGLPLREIRGVPRRALPDPVTVSLYTRIGSFNHQIRQSDYIGLVLRDAACAWCGECRLHIPRTVAALHGPL